MQQDQQSLEKQDQLSRNRALTYIKVQIVLAVVISAPLLYIDLVMAYSALTGGTIAVIANAWFTYKVFRIGAANDAKTMLASVYTGEVYKIVLTSALFVCAFVVIRPVNALVLLTVYFLIHISPLLVNLFGRNNKDIEIKREKNG